jgi:hypothetical protein
MTDTLVERVAGQTSAADTNIELQLLMPLDTLINPMTTVPRSFPVTGRDPAS